MKIAIVGMSGYFPGNDSVDSFIEGIYSGNTYFKHLLARYSAEELSPIPELAAIQCGFLNDSEGFDAKFFGIKENDALHLSSQQRLLLEVVYDAIHHSKRKMEDLKDRPIGIFIGAVNEDYLDAKDFMSPEYDAFYHIGSDISMLAGRISNYFGFVGPSEVICSACASSLVAIHQACQSIELGDSELAIAGGIYLVSLKRLLMHYRLGTLSRSGVCRPYDNSADGMLLGDGVGMVILKPYEKAIRDKDVIYAVIEGSGVNHEGGKGPIAQPTVEAQSALLKSIYKKFSINPENIAYIETHGTGTRVGDPVEFMALQEAFSSFTAKKQFCYLGTTKGNIGHSVSASGVIGLIKLIHVLNQGIAPKNTHLTEINHAIKLETSPFKFAMSTEPLQKGRGRLLGAVNAFGYVGTNAHLVISIPEKTESSSPSAIHFHHEKFTVNGLLPSYGHGLETINKEALPSDFSLKKIVSDLISAQEELIDWKKSFSDLGIDSILVVSLMDTINRELHINLPITITFDYPTVQMLQEEIEKNYLSKIGPKQVKESSSKEEATTDMDIAIIGISCRFPKSPDKEKFWQNLEQGISAIDKIPSNRWPIDEYYDTNSQKPWKMNTQWGGFLEDYDKFDHEFFSVSPKEALEMDPQQRVLMEEFWHVFEDAGYDPKSMPRSAIGTFTAAAHGDYVRNAERANYAPTGHMFVGNNLAILSARFAYMYDFSGPALNIDTACSSSLIAVHLACQSLLRQECKMALVGGVCIFSTEFNFLYYTKSGMLSPEGKCKVFDNEGNGFVPGEGVGAVLLKPLQQAIKDHDHIYAVIKATGSDQDGKTNGITAPSQKAQTDLQIELFKHTNINPETIGYVETHGTGTKLGDPIEVAALTRSFEKFTSKKQYCYLGSVKSNLGHTIMSAGIAGLIKAALSIHHQVVPPTLHVKTPNKYIDFANSPFKLPLEKSTWPSSPDHPRRALVNAFGMSGTNAQALLEEYIPKRDTQRNQKPRLFLFSAIDPEQLLEVSKGIRKYLKDNDQVNLDDMAYTLQVGRSHLAAKLAIVAENVQELESFLDRYIEGERVSLLSNQKDHSLTEIANRWLGGENSTWDSLYDEKPYRMSLPGYPFKKERYWIEAPKTRNQEASLEHDKVLTVRSLIEETLGIDTQECDPDKSLVFFGMDSILGLALQSKLESAFSITIPTKDMFEHLTINKLEKYVALVRVATAKEKTQEKVWTYEVEGNVTAEILKKEAKLPIDIRTFSNVKPQISHPHSYFITGTTGFLGAYLIHSLLEKTDAKLYCLIRSESIKEGIEKIKNNCKKYNLWNENYPQRIEVVLGNLESEKFGIDEKLYNELSEEIDCICHAGATVNHILSYYDLKNVNVNGTVEVIKFAATNRLKSIHYISTIGTVIRRILETGETNVLKEEATTDDAEGLQVGYSQSKWVSEQMLWQAKEQGVPVAIYRIGEITGASQMKQCRTDDMFHMLVKCFSELDCYPEQWPSGVVDIIPIDYVADAITAIMHHHYDTSGFYHLLHPHPCPAEDIFTWIRKEVKPLSPVLFDEWRERCVEHLQKDAQSTRSRVLMQIFRDTPFGYRFTWYFKEYALDMTNTVRLLHKHHVSCPKLDSQLFNNIFNYILETND